MNTVYAEVNPKGAIAACTVSVMWTVPAVVSGVGPLQLSAEPMQQLEIFVIVSMIATQWQLANMRMKQL